jgi:hypothetical protein
MSEGLDPSKLNRIDKQRVRIDNPDKAHEMAEMEGFFRNNATEYSMYLAGPDEFIKNNKEPVMSLFGMKLPTKAEKYAYFSEQGVTPEWLIAQGEQEADVVGSVADYREEMHSKTDEELKSAFKELAREFSRGPEKYVRGMQIKRPDHSDGVSAFNTFAQLRLIQSKASAVYNILRDERHVDMKWEVPKEEEKSIWERWFSRKKQF